MTIRLEFCSLSPWTILTSVMTRLIPSHTHPEHVKLGIDGPSQIDRCIRMRTISPGLRCCSFRPASPPSPCPAPPDMPLGINPLRNLPRNQCGQELSSTALQPIQESSADPIGDGKLCAGATAERLHGWQRSHSTPEVTPGFAVRRKSSCVAQDVVVGEDDARHLPSAARGIHGTRADRMVAQLLVLCACSRRYNRNPHLTSSHSSRTCT